MWKTNSKLWELINTSVKLQKIQNQETTNYTKGKQGMILFTNVIRYIEINLRKNTKDLYCETIR